MSQSKKITDLIDELSKIPGIGPRTAERIAFHILNASRGEVGALARAIVSAKKSVQFCKECRNLTDTSPCRICSDHERDKCVVCVVEQPNDVWAIEKSGAFKGQYHVLYGHISALEGIGPENLTIGILMERIKIGVVTEVIIATNPTLEGDGTALYLRKLLSKYNVAVSRIARGIPSGSSLNYATSTTITEAFDGRQKLG